MEFGRCRLALAALLWPEAGLHLTWSVISLKPQKLKGLYHPLFSVGPVLPEMKPDAWI